MYDAKKDRELINQQDAEIERLRAILKTAEQSDDSLNDEIKRMKALFETMEAEKDDTDKQNDDLTAENDDLKRCQTANLKSIHDIHEERLSLEAKLDKVKELVGHIDRVSNDADKHKIPVIIDLIKSYKAELEAAE